MVKRLYAHNFRCFQNFELKLGDDSTYLLIGKNGVGKSTVRKVLEIFQALARGENRISELVRPRDFPRTGNGKERKDGEPEIMRFEIECQIDGRRFTYSLALELPPAFHELRVAQETLQVGPKLVYSRELAQVFMPRNSGEAESRFRVDWHLVALPIVQETSEEDPLFQFRRFLRNMIILAPLPSLMSGESTGATLQPVVTGENFAAWFTGLLALSPASYSQIDSYMRDVHPDFQDIQNPLSGTDSRNLTVQFKAGGQTLSLPLRDLSDGEKCYLISATVLAGLHAYGPSLCFWDEPDNHLALSEVGHFIMGLRRMPEGCQLIATSHHPEAIRKFAGENTLLLHRASHLEPTQVRPVSELQIPGDLIDALIRGDEQP